MKRKKYRELNLYSYYDFSGMARHLEDMARQGWQLENIGSQFWTYRRCPPTEMRYAVVYFEKASDLDTAPLQEQQDFWEMCRTAGWELAASRGVMQIFRNPDPHAVPIETDPVVQVEKCPRRHEKNAGSFLCSPAGLLPAANLACRPARCQRPD